LTLLLEVLTVPNQQKIVEHQQMPELEFWLVLKQLTAAELALED